MGAGCGTPPIWAGILDIEPRTYLHSICGVSSDIAISGRGPVTVEVQLPGDGERVGGREVHDTAPHNFAWPRFRIARLRAPAVHVAIALFEADLLALPATIQGGRSSNNSWRFYDFHSIS